MPHVNVVEVWPSLALPDQHGAVDAVVQVMLDLSACLNVLGRVTLRPRPQDGAPDSSGSSLHWCGPELQDLPRNTLAAIVTAVRAAEVKWAAELAAERAAGQQQQAN